MRPLPTGATAARTAAIDDAADSIAPSSSSSQMTFILADEASTDGFSCSPTSLASSNRFRDHRKPAAQAWVPHRNERSPSDGMGSQSRHAGIGSSGSNKSPSPPKSLASPIALPLTPSTSGTSGPPSMLSDPSSRRDSLAASLSEDQGSLVLSMLDESWTDNMASVSGADHGIFEESQLIMPTISVPSRRPFTREGRSLGRLKVLVAGQPGLGKTSLIRAIIQSCRHIIHVDPAVPAITRGARGIGNPITSNSQFPAVTETYASTRPIPAWRDSLDRASLVWRHGLGDAALDRNLCFVDTAGLSTTRQHTDAASQISRYMERHLHRSLFEGLSDSEVINIVSDGGGILVDAILYLIPRTGLTNMELDLLLRLSAHTSIIPILAQADTLSSEEIEFSQMLITNQLREGGIGVFAFEPMDSDGLPRLVHAVSSKGEGSHNAMDGSFPTESEYSLPMAGTDFSALVSAMFSAEGGMQLRHAAARKLVNWRGLHRHRHGTPAGSTQLVYHSSEKPAPLVIHQTSRSSYRNLGGWSKVQFVNWAADLQRGLMNEQAAYAQAIRQHHADWLRNLSRISSDTSAASTLAPSETFLGRSPSQMHERHHATSIEQSKPAVSLQDPLGILELGTQLKRSGLRTLEIIGSAGLVGVVVVWVLG